MILPLGKGVGWDMILPGCCIIICVLLVYLTENEYICNTIKEGFIGLMIINLRKPCRNNNWKDEKITCFRTGRQ